MSSNQLQPLILPFNGIRPRIDPSAFLANAVVIGDVEIGARSSIWFGVTIRGDVHSIRIGKGTNIQDGSVVHCTRDRFSTIIGDHVTVGHMALLHGCVVEDNAFIGMKACVMDGVVVESGAMVAAGALVTPGKRVKAGELWGGSPARFLRPLTDEDRLMQTRITPSYADMAEIYLAEVGGGPG
ncbi:gamma carbonic anhydrase family protein [Niveispirillum irakense]|uniref:gamma carbonic anhydrase family protein n=1 Tax=Niveispirillum irakense TaxID=34011 RepID=UPI000422E001|nr:gamma carbonic anhydrase family protein [Niveispirillum irakense]